MPKKRYLCPICGYPDLKEPPWGKDGATPSYDICPCCGCEFGYEDARPEGADKFRQKWIEGGGTWFEPKKRPEAWDMTEQLKGIGT
ncbi:MAG: hypothetical protein HYU64_00430 [Armatimonadetes bacterium]|nr:hypothetical protein [Armatimonadota bacterium]